MLSKSPNNKKKLLRVAIYLRLSDEDKDKKDKDDDSESIKNQRRLLLEEIEKRPEFILAGEYSDEDLSGAGTFRPEFERLIKDCQDGKIDVVLCKSQSRFSRDMEIIEKYIHNKFIEWNIRFIGLADNADTANAGNKKARQINGLVNEWYLEDVSNNIRSAFKAKMKEGEFISPFAPFGYEISKSDNNKLVIDKDASAIVQDIFNLYLKGLGFTSIANHLNNRGIPSPSLYKYQKGIKLNTVSNKPREEIKWSSSAIKRILTNEVYLGHLVQGKRTTVSYKNHKIKSKSKEEWIKCTHTHTKIIDEETFIKVQNIIKSKQRPLKKTGTIHIFSGKVFCKACNHIMRKKNSSKHEYLVCSNSTCTNKISIRYDILERIILKAINNKINTYYDIDYLKDKINSIQSNSLDNKIKNIEFQKLAVMDEMSKNQNYLKSLYEDKINNIITKEEFQDLTKEYRHIKELLNNKINILNNELNISKSKKIINPNELLNKYKTFHHLNRIIIEEFIEKIYISKLNKRSNTRDIQIIWSFK